MILDEGAAFRCISGRFIRLTGGFSFLDLSDVIPCASRMERALQRKLERSWIVRVGRKQTHTVACYHHLQAQATIDDSLPPFCLLKVILSLSA